MIRDGQYYVTKTLLWCDEADDRNIRRVHRWPSDDIVAVFNPGMRRWTEEHQRALTAFMSTMSDERHDPDGLARIVLVGVDGGREVISRAPGFNIMETSGGALVFTPMNGAENAK